MLIKFLPFLLSLASSILEIVGAYTLYKFAIPPHASLFSGAFMNDGSKIADEIKINGRYRRNARKGFLLLLVAFALQLLLNFVNFTALVKGS
jgi:hypothetical protein